MDQITDTLYETAGPVYADFKTRTIASLFDAVILMPITFGFMYCNLLYIKSVILSILIAMATLVYKCFMEKNYGATFGKKIMKIQVVSETLQQLSYKEVFIRNYMNFLMLIMGFLGIYVLYMDADFYTTTTLNEILKLRMDTMPTSHKTMRYLLSFFFLMDCLFILKYRTKQTLHDRWAKTLVIKHSL